MSSCVTHGWQHSFTECPACDAKNSDKYVGNPFMAGQWNGRSPEVLQLEIICKLDELNAKLDKLITGSKPGEK